MGHIGIEPHGIAYAHSVAAAGRTDTPESSDRATGRDVRQACDPEQGAAVSLGLACVLWLAVVGLSYAIGGPGGVALGSLGVVGLTACVLGVALRRAPRATDASRLSTSMGRSR